LTFNGTGTFGVARNSQELLLDPDRTQMLETIFISSELPVTRPQLENGYDITYELRQCRV